MNHTMTQRVKALFEAHPDLWIDASDLMTVGGKCGWRTRVSDCRTQHGMVIENRTIRHRGYTVSEYRYRRLSRSGEAAA